MGDSPLGRFFGVATRPRTWLNLLFHVLAFPLGLFYFIFLIVGLRAGPRPRDHLGRHSHSARGGGRLVAVRRLRAARGPASSGRRRGARAARLGKRERRMGQAEGAFRQRLNLERPCIPAGQAPVRYRVVHAARRLRVRSPAGSWPFRSRGTGTFTLSRGTADRGFTPPLWLAILAVPGAVLMFFAGLHLMNAWSWICARWAEIMLRTAPPPAVAVVAPLPLVTTAPLAAPAAPAAPAPPRGGRSCARASGDSRAAAGSRSAGGSRAAAGSRSAGCGASRRSYELTRLEVWSSGLLECSRSCARRWPWWPSPSRSSCSAWRSRVRPVRATMTPAATVPAATARDH